MTRYSLTGAGLVVLAAGLTLAARGQTAQTAQAGSAAPAQAAAIIHDTFEENDGGWTAAGSGGHLSVTHDPANVKTGKGALQLDYQIAKGDVAMLNLPIMGDQLAKAGTIRFQVRTSSRATLACILQEGDGGRYIAMFHAPKDRWQQVELAPSDFLLSEDANDPPDPDGKLDMDQVAAIAIADIGQVVAQADSPELNAIFGLTPGPRTLYLDDFEVTATPLPAAAGGPTKQLDTFARPQAGWITAGDTRISVTAGKPLEGRGLSAEYDQAPGKIVGLVRRVRRGAFAGAAGLTFDAASRRPAKLLVQVEEKGGGKYNTIVDLPGGQTLQHLTANFASLNPADDSHDTNGKLDPDQINQVVFIDVTGIVDQTEADNALWLGNLRVKDKAE